MAPGRPPRRRLGVALALLCAGAFCLSAALGHATGPVSWPWSARPDRTAATGEALGPSQPTSIAIPELDLVARVRPVGLDHTGAIAAPPMRRAHETGWYEQGPTPGQYGAAVIVGHVDDSRGPAVFHGLAELRPGARIEVTRRDRQVATFEVTRVANYDKAALPVQEVYGDFSEPALRLITCGGAWVGGERGYAENVVVFAVLVAG